MRDWVSGGGLRVGFSFCLVVGCLLIVHVNDWMFMSVTVHPSARVHLKLFGGVWKFYCFPLSSKVYRDPIILDLILINVCSSADDLEYIPHHLISSLAGNLWQYNISTFHSNVLGCFWYQSSIPIRNYSHLHSPTTAPFIFSLSPPPALIPPVLYFLSWSLCNNNKCVIYIADDYTH